VRYKLFGCALNYDTYFLQADWETIEMLKWFKQLDQILRGDATLMSLLAEGQIQTPVAGLSVFIVLLGVLYGLCAGSLTTILMGGTFRCPH
jgi:hypothetical protein